MVVTSNYGNTNARRKLTQAQVDWVRATHLKWNYLKQYGDKHYSVKAMAEKLGVHPRTLENVLNFETWNI